MDNCQCIETNVHEFPIAKHRLLQAILFVNDMFMLAPKTTENLFLQDVENFFEMHGIRTNRNVSFIGKSGLIHKFEFAIPGIKEIPGRLIKTMSSGNNSMYAKSILTDVQEIRPVVEYDTVFYVFFNDIEHNEKNLKLIKI